MNWHGSERVEQISVVEIISGAKDDKIVIIKSVGKLIIQMVIFYSISKNGKESQDLHQKHRHGPSKEEFTRFSNYVDKIMQIIKRMTIDT